MHNINLFLTWVSIHKEILLSVAGGSAGLSALLEVILHKFKVDSKKIAYSLIHVFSAITALATYYLSATSGQKAVGIYAALALVAQTWHRFVISPAYNKYIAPFLNYLQTNKAQPATPAAPTTPLDPPAPTPADSFTS